jgi:hypothetical protein
VSTSATATAAVLACVSAANFANVNTPLDKKCHIVVNSNVGRDHRFERITRYNLGLARVGNSLETVGCYTNKS